MEGFPEAVPMKMDLRICVGPRNLLDMPDLVLKNICEFLDRGGLMNLRLTSRHLKATVEQPTHLEKLPVKVVCSKQLQRIIQSNVPFNNFNLSFSSIEEQSYLNEFAVRFGSNIKILKIRSAGGHHKIAKLLEKCVQIRELELERMCPSVLTASDNTELFKTMLYNFRNLDKLIIHNFQDQNVSGVIAVNTFLRILKNCKRLRYFNIPFMDKYNEKLALQRFQRVQAGVEENIQVHNQENNNALIEEEENWEEDQPFPMRNDPLPEWNPDSDHDILIHPIIDYIITRRIGNKCDKIRQIDVDSRNYFELLPRSMRDLLQVSLKEEISILNINSNKLSYIVNEVKQWNAEYWRVVKSASVTNLFSGFSLSDLQNVEELNFVVHPRANPSTRDFRMTEDSYIWPKLKSVCVKLLGENNPVVVDRLIKEIERPTITKLHLEWCVLGPCKTVLGKNLHHNFPNLRELAMNGWDGTDDEFCTIWRDMKKLEVIHLRDCKYLSNRSFEGMCNLKMLHTLTIHDTTGRINHDAFMDSFKWISLRYFEFTSTITLKITWDLYKDLSDTPLGRSIEYFKAPRPMPHPFLNERHVMSQKYFKNLKRRQLS